MVFKTFKSPFAVRPAYVKRRSRASFCRTPGRTPTPSSLKTKPANIKVCVRVRPPNSLEGSFPDSRIVVRPLDEKVLVFDPRELQTPSFYKGRVIKDPTTKRNKDLKLAFDRVFDVEATNQDVFEHTTKDMLDHLMDGVNCSVFAYGATGAGKTHTMLGNSTSPGVIFRTMQDLYVRIDAAKDDVVCNVEVSYLEIYNETVRDLLRPESGILAVREDGDQGILVTGLTLHKPTDAGDLLQMLEFGNCNRTQHPTDANKESSRSHAVFQLILKQSPKTVDISSDVLVSKMALIDLAGSERATATTNSGERFREGANINKSLLALGNCINALAEGKKGAHIPYRDSKLTRILKDSLGGTCHTVMIANVSPSSLSYEDTYNTLKYADRAKHIKADLKKNIFRVDQHIHQYGKIVQELHTEVDNWKAKFKNAQRTIDVLENKLKLSGIDVNKKCAPSSFGSAEKIVNEMKLYLSKYIEMQNELLRSQSQKNIIEVKLSSRECAQTHLNLLQWDPDRKEQDTCRTERIRKQCQVRIEKLDRSIDQLKLGLVAMKEEMKNCAKRLKSSSSDFFSSFAFEAFQNETRLCHLNGINKYISEVFQLEKVRFEHSDRAVSALCSLTREQHLILSSYDHMTPSLKLQFENVMKLLQSDKEVSWSDENASKSVSLSEFLDCVVCFSPSSSCSVGSSVSSSSFGYNISSPRTEFSTLSSYCASVLNQTFDLDEAFQETPSGSADKLLTDRFAKDFNENLSLAPVMPKPCRKTYLMENIMSSVSPSPATTSTSAATTTTTCTNGVFSPLREIGNNTQRLTTVHSKLPSPSTPVAVPIKKNFDIDDDGFKRPSHPLPRKTPSLSATQRQNIEDVKRYGLPSFTENFVLNTRRPPNRLPAKPSSLLKSPSVSNLREKFEKPPSCSRLKKTFSTSNLKPFV